MTEETWRIILEQNAGGGDAGGGAGGAGAGSGETPNQRKQLFEDAGKVFGAIASTAGMLAILIRSIGGSTVASTFMEVIFKILGALWDLFLIQFLPIFMVLVRWLLSLMPVVTELGNALKPLIELIADKLEGLLNAITEWIVPRLIEFAKALTTFATTGDISPLLAWGEKFFKDLFEIASKLFMDFINWLKEKGPSIVESIGKSVTIFADWLKTNGPTIMNTVVSGIKLMKETLEPLWNQLVAVLGPIFEEVFKPLTDKAKEYWNWLMACVKTIWDNLYEYIKSVAKVLFDWLKLEITWIISLMATLMGTAMGNLWHFMTGDKNGTGAAAIAAAIANAPPHPVMAPIPSIDNTLKKISASLPSAPALLTASNETKKAIDYQTELTIKKLDGLQGAVEKQQVVDPSAIHRQQTAYWGHCDYKAPAVAQSSNQNQTSNVMYLARKKIFEDMTGLAYTGS